MRMARPNELSADDARNVMLGMPFEKFERRRFLQYDKGDLAFIRFSPTLWRQLTAEDLALVRRCCAEAIET